MSEHITYARLLKIAEEYSTYSCNSDGNKRFVHRALERMFYRGKHGSLIGLCMCADMGCITLPEDVEHVEKVKVNGITQSTFSHWFEFSNCRESDFYKSANGVQHLPNKYYTQYDSPFEKFEIVVKARNKNETSGSYIIIHGKDITGNKVFLRHDNKNEAGEFLPIVSGKLVVGSIPFTEITGIEKSKTKGYIDLFARNPEDGELVFLSSYSPRDEKPVYTRIKILGCADDQKVRVDMLARLKILANYEDNELIPVVGLDVLESILQELRLQKTNDFNNSVAAGQISKELIRDENNYKYGNNDDALDIVDMDGTDGNGGVW